MPCGRPISRRFKVSSWRRSALSETSIDVAAMKQRMISSAARAVVLADSSKFRHPAFCDVCAATEVHAIVTDSGIADIDRRRLEEAGVEVIVAGNS